ncbi:MAG: calcineurin-like phosphoesterase family protein [Fidelibacterota bacterium]|nr:MAG: calcineurin-like phosphoesterase family protein [Candidatus Neomarinimicrobiota bacterium]
MADPKLRLRQYSYTLNGPVLMFCFLLWGSLLTPILAENPGTSTKDTYVSGVVYRDANRNLERDRGEQGVAGVLVSNQREVVITDKRGRYTLPADDEMVVFITKPAGYNVPVNEHNLPQFYYVHQPEGSPDLEYPGVSATGPLPNSVDFPLFPEKTASKVQALMFGDTQPYNNQELDYLRDDIVAELVGTEADFGIVLGDVVGNDLSLYERYIRLMAQIGIPIYNVPGNHDINYDSPDDHYALETFKRYYGPSYYSFDYGQTHFIVLDDVEYLGRDDEGHTRYRGRIGEQQLNWLAHDLQLVPDDKLVVLTMHIPFDQGPEAGPGTRVTDTEALYDILEKRSYVLALAGHMHTNEHRYLAKDEGWDSDQPLHQIVCGAACGSWWSGPKDERSVPISYQTDGTPNGYYLFDFQGHEYQARFKAAGQDPGEQLRIMLPGRILATDALDTLQVVVNVYDGGPRSVVEYQIDNQSFKTMEWMIRTDPLFTQLTIQYPDLFRNWVSPRLSRHIWTTSAPGDLSPGVHTITVQTTDRYGQTYDGHLVFEVR